MDNAHWKKDFINASVLTDGLVLTAVFYWRLNVRTMQIMTMVCLEQYNFGFFINLSLKTDGMVDCSDSECCSHPGCSDHIMCISSNDPVEVLLRKQPPSVTASFYQRVKFLIEENSVQSYAHIDEYTER